MKLKVALIARMGVLIALGVVSSYFSAIPIPLIGAKVFPIQHAINVVAGATIGPWYGAVTALGISLMRLALGTGTPLAIPGSVFGVVLAGLLYQKFHSRVAAMVGEMVGTGIIGALVAYPVAVYLLGNTKAAAAGATFYVVPFGMNTVAGALIGGLVLAVLSRTPGSLRAERS